MLRMRADVREYIVQIYEGERVELPLVAAGEHPASTSLDKHQSGEQLGSHIHWEREKRAHEQGIAGIGHLLWGMNMGHEDIDLEGNKPSITGHCVYI